jgi:protein CpxP
MNNKTIKTMLLVLAVSVTGTSYVAAHSQHASEDSSMGMMGMGSVDSEDMHRDGMGMGNMSMTFSQLNLTDQQKQEIQAITAASINENHQNMGDMQVHHADMQALLSNTVFDENKAKTLMANHQSEMGERMLAMLKMQHQIFQLLDDQQKEQSWPCKITR